MKKFDKDYFRLLANEAALVAMKAQVLEALKYVFVYELEGANREKIIKRYERKFGKLDKKARMRAETLLWKYDAVEQRRHLNHFIKIIKQSDGAE